MVAKITTPGRPLGALHYNENKVAKGKAVCIHASGFLWEHNEMSFTQKAEGFQRLNCRNERAKTKALHVSLNFDPSEKLSVEKLREIASTYMDKIGFGNQPYIVYKHSDAGHPHIHIVSNTIREDGSRINTHNIGRNQSEKARKEIEVQYSLVKAEKKSNPVTAQPLPVPIALSYGKTETKKAIEQVLNYVLNNYVFCSVPQLNAVLRKYGIEADQGLKESRVYKHGGLNYRMLDNNGNPIGVPIKASMISGKPIMSFLEKTFERNKESQQRLKPIIKKIVDEAITKHPKDLRDLTELLDEKGIDVLLRKASDGKIYGITFVDHLNKAVINGSELGKAYSAAHLQKTLSSNPVTSAFTPDQINHSAQVRDSTESLVEILLAPEREFNDHAGHLLKKKRKRKNKFISL